MRLPTLPMKGLLFWGEHQHINIPILRLWKDQNALLSEPPLYILDVIPFSQDAGSWQVEGFSLGFPNRKKMYEKSWW